MNRNSLAMKKISLKHILSMVMLLAPLSISLGSYAQLSDDEKNVSADEANATFYVDEQTETENAPSQTDTPATTPPTSHTVRYFCTQGNLERRVEIHFPNAPTLLPCSVNYYKDVEAPGETQVLWQANNTLGYCELRAAEFVAQLRNQDWDCSTQ